MKKCLIVYFSGTGNTKFVAENFQKSLEQRGIEVDIFDLEKSTDYPKDYDYLMLGAPIYAELYPSIFLEFIEKKFKAKKVPTLFFTTMAANNIPTAFTEVILKYAKNKLTIKYTEKFIMPNNFFNFMFKETPVNFHEKLKSDVNLKVEKTVEDFLKGKEQLFCKNSLWCQFTKVTYLAFYKLYAPFIFKKIRIDQDLCNKCRLCERSCPTKSIDISKSPCISKTCILCQRCMNSCPQNAFLYKENKIKQYKL